MCNVRDDGIIRKHNPQITLHRVPIRQLNWKVNSELIGQIKRQTKDSHTKPASDIDENVYRSNR